MPDDLSDAPKNLPQREQAVALQYTQENELPRVLLSGAGHLAREIIQVAADSGVPIQENQELVSLLSRVEAGKDISPETYRLVAEVISFLYYADTKWAEEHSFLDDLMEPVIDHCPDEVPNLEEG